ncbi:hypothetical protein TWF703_010545 [Orbilia oligospora]|uniref:DUF7587 domain-containing protein n=1 Tax=Orbilia oligospora TaxID=2813651 RepID=A0A7C8JLL3_ORBOL|nr:hypothetical protein TWF703_010545 [Orbilia oligospora]
MLIQSAETITSQAQCVKSLADDAKSSVKLPITEVCSLREGIKKLTDITFNLQSTINALNEATERSVIIRLRSLGSQITPIVSKILSHFDEQIKDIVREVFDKTSDQDVLWKVAEECYNQVVSSSGKLNADDYFATLEEACLERPYDPDFESEEYYEHENRLVIDEDYATAFQKQTEHRSEALRKDRQSWPEFWIRVLNNSPAGPTLFYPPACFNTQSLNLDSTPQYLFRTFDGASSGQNNESVIASEASIIGPHESSRTDILRLGMHEATKLLYTHLTKRCFKSDNTGEKSDNLMSWTSSLLFAIQYAVWRHGIRKCDPFDIKICAVDTRHFPQGQFAQDIWLLEAYYATADRMGDPERKFFNFRLQNKCYYNGEYLSQGAVNHIGRSCVVSLGHLKQAGLFQLYPEFEDASGSGKWTKRVLGLRQNWSAEQCTTDQEIQLAFKVAYDCFTQFEPIDIASILLTFKNRKGPRLNPIKISDHFKKQWPKWADKPVEVCRYWIASEAVSYYNRLSDIRISRVLLQHHKTLREIFD